jgi:hypothetical protein
VFAILNGILQGSGRDQLTVTILFFLRQYEFYKGNEGSKQLLICCIFFEVHI